MECSTADGQHMDFATFQKAIQFGLFLRNSVYVISGGEPTLHPQLFEFCRYLDKVITSHRAFARFSVMSNGTWFSDPDKVEAVRQLSRLPTYTGMQVYTNPKWYRHADYILQHKDEISSIEGVLVDTHDIASMQDLGRAKDCAEAMAEVKASPYHMGCLNGHLLFKQLSDTTKMYGIVQAGIMCKPMVDYKGDVHLSESCQCQSFGNVNTDYMMTIYNNLKASKPCYGCYLGKKFLASTDPKIVMAKEMLSR
jgi:MoaA/NifB/PqqE/SkfB family radical SAM enzyme